MVDPSDHVTVSMRKRRKTTAILGFFRRFIRKPELILAECAAAPWDVVGSSELSEEFRTFRLFFSANFARKAALARAAATIIPTTFRNAMQSGAAIS